MCIAADIQADHPPDRRSHVRGREVGEFESGFTAAWFGLVPAIVSGGVVTLVVAGLWAAVLFPRLWRMQTFDQLKDNLANAT